MEIDLSGGNSINTPYKINKSDNSFTFTVPIHSTSGTTYFEIEEDQTYNINAYNTIHVTGQYHQPTISAPSADLSRYQIWTRRGYMYAHRALQVDETFNVSGTKYQLSFENLNDGNSTFSISGTTAADQTLSISEDSADPDGTGTLSYSWQIYDDYFGWATVGTSSTYTIRSSNSYASSDDGRSIRAVISYQDAQGFDESVTTATSSIPAVNHGEAVFGLVDTSDLTGIYSTDSVKVGDTIKKGDVGSDPDHGHRWQTESYSWQTSSDNSTWNEVGTSETYTILAADDNKSIRAVVSYTDNQGFNEVVNTHSVNVINDAGDASFSIVGTKSVGNYLWIRTDSQDPDGTGKLSCLWQSSSDGSTWSNVSTNSTYRLQYTDSDNYYRASVSYTDDDGFSETITTDTIKSINIPYILLLTA